MDTKIHETRYSDLAKFSVFERESGDFWTTETRYVSVCDCGRQKSKGVTPKTQNPRMYKLHQSMQFIHLQLSTARNLFPQASRAVSKTWDASTINDRHQSGAKISPKATKWKCLGALPNATSTVTGTKLTSSTCFNWGGFALESGSLTEESTYN